MTLPRIEVTGYPYRQGLQHGRFLREGIRHNLNVYFDRFLREGGVKRRDVLQRAERFAAAIAELSPLYEAGMRGIAEGARSPYLEIVSLNVRYEILYYEYMRKQVTTARDGCTAFAVAPSLTREKGLLLGQNWDWIPEVSGAIVCSRNPDGVDTLAFTEAGVLGGKIGLNSAGLGLTINGLSSTTDDWSRLGKPFHVRCYEILRQPDLRRAQEAAQAGIRACSANYLLAQAPGEAVNLETAPTAVKKTKWQDGILVHANHFVDAAELGVTEPPDDARRFSCLRHEKMEIALRSGIPLSVKGIQAILRDHANGPRSICRHEDPAAPIDERYRTVTSVIIDLQHRDMWASNGPPCQNSYDHFTLERATPGRRRRG